jgi:hypothetical protein
VDARGARGVFHLLARGAGAAVGDVVFDRVVEQHRVLRHDADGAAHARLRDLADVVAADGDAALLHVVEAVQQPCQRGLARPRRADHGHRLAGRDLEAQVLAGWARGFVGEADVLEADGGIRAGQRLRTGRVAHLAVFFHQHEHLVQVGQALLDLAVDHAQEVQRNVELDHEGVDHHQVAQRHAPFDHARGGAPQHQHQAHRDQRLLAGVEHAQRALALDGGLAVAVQAGVVALRLELLVVEVLDGLVVDERVDRAALRHRVELVHGLAELRAPFGHRDREADVQHQRRCR